jgi:hypothetical protein
VTFDDESRALAGNGAFVARRAQIAQPPARPFAHARASALATQRNALPTSVRNAGFA